MTKATDLKLMKEKRHFPMKEVLNEHLSLRFLKNFSTFFFRK